MHESMSYKDRLSHLERAGERSLTQQLVDAIVSAIESGELAADEKLPPTRELAELAGVNHLTAVRAYRRLRELGLVTAHVGRGTFVRGAAQTPAPSVPDSIAWQRYALPEDDETYGDRVLAEMYTHSVTEGLIPLSVGYPSARIFPTEKFRAAAEGILRSEPQRAMQYSDVRGTPELAEQVAALSAARGAPEDLDDIVVTTGAAQALTVATRAILRPGDVVACEDPSFVSVLRAIRSAGATVQAVPVDGDGLDVDALEGLLARTEIKLLALQPRLHNPTGRDLSPQRRARLLELIRRHGFFVVEDGLYADLRFEGEELPSLRAEAPAHVIYCDSFSKVIGGGLRAGWVAASGPVLDRIVSEKRADDIHSPTLTQLAVAGYLASGAFPEQVERARRDYLRGAEALLGAIDEHLGPIATYPTPLGGGHVWVTLDAPITERELVDEAGRQGVAYAPGGALRVERHGDLSMRLSFCYVEPDDLVEGVRRLARAVRAARDRPSRRAAVPI
jgi:2-aminoadipate transaminase